MSEQEFTACVIGVSAIAGGGKTTLTRHLLAWFGDALLVAFDDYDMAGMITVDWAFEQWRQTGVDFNAWKMPQLASDLARLKSGESIQSPLDGAEIAPKPVIIFEAPLGREHAATADLIDFLVWIATPLEVGLARFLLGLQEHSKWDAAKPWGLPEIQGELRQYLASTRMIYHDQTQRVGNHCDLRVDGLLPPEEVAQHVIQHLPEHIQELQKKRATYSV